MRKSQNLGFFCESISIFLSCCLLSLCLPCLLAVLLPTLSSLFCMELWLANFLGKGQIDLQRVVCKQQNRQWIFPQNVTFFSKCNSERIGQNIQNEVSLKLLLFITLYPASRGLLIFLDTSGRLKRSIVWWDKTGTILEPRMNQVLKHENRVEFWETSIFYTHHLKGFQETIYFSRNITITIRTYIECTANGTCVYNMSEVKFKFLGDKKGPTKGFYLEFWKNWLSIFVSSLSFELSQLFLYLWRFVFTGIARDSVN